ncbi:MAG: hypothetical protein FK734_04815 [Asgard group archaeon]|nr:hypothetical protein [Asgard group archaeon]
MSKEKIPCPNCGKKIESWLVYCEFCGQSLQPKEGSTKTPTVHIKSNVTVKTIPATETTEGKKVVIVPKQKQKRKRWSIPKDWYKPKPRKRPWYHPLELLFWIGWGLVVFFGCIGLVLWWLLKEIGRYIKWLCYWGPPDDLKKKKEEE